MKSKIQAEVCGMQGESTGFIRMQRGRRYISSWLPAKLQPIFCELELNVCGVNLPRLVFVHHSTAYAILRAAFNQLLKRGREVLSFDANLDSRGHTGFTTLKCSTKDEKIYFYCLQTDTQIQSCQLFKLSNTYKTAQ